MRIRPFLIGSLAAAALAAALPARADWFVSHLSRPNADGTRRLRIEAARHGRWVEGDVIVTRGTDERATPIAANAHGSLHRSKDGKPGNFFASDRAPALPLTETRKEDQLRYHFRVRRDELSQLYFEFREPQELGGDIYWFTLADFVRELP